MAAPRRRGRLWRYRRLWFMIGILLVATVAGLALVVAQVPFLPADPPIQATILYDATGAELATLAGAENRISIPLDDVPMAVQRAVIAAEDRSFYTHKGIDLRGILRAAWVDVRNQEVSQGGSTITQQYVKNTYVGSQRTLIRKLREAIISVKLERSLGGSEEGKRKILEKYLNTVYFGRGAYGIQAASRAYFGRDTGDLDLSSAAYLVGLIRSPSIGDAATDPALATKLRANVLTAMEETDAITAEQANAAAAKPLAATLVARTEARSSIALTGAGVDYFVEFVRRQLVQKLGPNGDELVRKGGLKVYTTLDPALQRGAYTAVYSLLNARTDPSGALVSLDRGGQVVAMVGGRDWATSQVNLAVGSDGGGGGRQGGSTFKPFLLAETIRAGYSLRSSFPGPAKIVLPKADNGKDWEVSNYEDASYGTIDLVKATTSSVNTVYAQLVEAIGPENVVTMAKRLGIDSPLSPVPSIVLGTQNVSVSEMATAYNTFATGGIRVAPKVFTRVELDGKEQPIDQRPNERVLGSIEARRVNDVLRAVVEQGSGTRARLANTVVRGKTGTSDDFGDAWFVGSTDKLTTAVWMGYPDTRRAMRNVQGAPQVSGGSLPAEIFKRFMTKATAGAVRVAASVAGDPAAGGPDRLVPGSSFPSAPKAEPAEEGTSPETTVGGAPKGEPDGGSSDGGPSIGGPSDGDGGKDRSGGKGRGGDSGAGGSDAGKEASGSGVVPAPDNAAEAPTKSD